jgi:predicted ATP-grasp superfamily ATP-dependent carboligase
LYPIVPEDPYRQSRRILADVQTPGVLVTDGHLRSSLAVVRSLGIAGYRVHVCSPRRRSLAGSSRYAAGDVRVPEALSDPAAFSEAVTALARRHGVSLLFPMSEEALLALLPALDGATDVRVPFASLDTFRRTSDKRFVMELAAQHGIAVPEQTVVEHREALNPSALSQLRFPIVLKPSRSVAGDGPDRSKMGVTYADNANELARRLAEFPPAAYPILLQQKIEGPGTGVFLLMWDSELVAQFAHRRIREKPPTGGVSVCAESIAADVATVAQSRALVQALDWHGPAMVEYKQDRVTGTRYLMEINARFWGSLQLAIDAGVDFPSLLASVALGKRPAPVTAYKVGVRCHWWWGEVDHLIARLRRGDSAMRTVGTFLLSGRDARNEVLRVSDPWPAVRESIDWFRGL